MRFILRHLPILTVALLVGCSSPQERTIKDVEKAHKDGFARAAHSSANQALANADGLSPEQIARLERVRDDSRQRLIRYAVSQINQGIMSTRYQDALTLYIRTREEFPEVARNNSLNRRIMRAFVREGNLEAAREVAGQIYAADPSENDRNDADAFIASLDDLEAAARTRNELAQTVGIIGDSIGVEFTSIDFAPSCVVMKQLEPLAPETQQVVQRYFDAVMAESSLKASLGKVPNAIN
jgi:hypothetical protein